MKKRSSVSSSRSQKSSSKKPSAKSSDSPPRSNTLLQPAHVVPGELILAQGDIIAFEGRQTADLVVGNVGDRPIQVGSHCHFFESNRALKFDRAKAFGFRLQIPAGTAVRFEPGEEKRVALVAIGGNRVAYGVNGLTNGRLDDLEVRSRALAKAAGEGFIEKGKG
jgi:urease beta subunit